MAIYATETAAGSIPEVVPATSRVYPWIVFGIIFGLLLSDYMSRQVLNAVFPLLKIEWGLSDTQLGSLAGVVALLTGLLTFPLSLAADRLGRVRSIALMAVLWSVATLVCALASNYHEMFFARFLVGVGEAAYGSVGVALVLSMFPPGMRSSLTGLFMAGGAFGSVFGMAFGGSLAVRFGWRWAFGGMAAFGGMLVLLYAIVVTEQRIGGHGGSRAARATRAPIALPTLLGRLFSSVSVICAYVGSGLQLFIMAALIAWLPSYFNRYAGMAPDRAGLTAGLFVLVGAAGMIGCGIATDRLARHDPSRKWVMAIVYCVLTAIFLAAAFRTGIGWPQMVLLALGMFFAAGTAGPAGAMVANLTPVAVHATAFATLTIANNLLGLAPGPFLTGFVADRIGLLGALQWVPMAALAATAAFWIGRRFYASDLMRIAAWRESVGD